MNEIATLLNLDDADRADFEERYAELRTRRIERVRKSMRADFVDYAVLYEQIKAYFAEEDELVGRLHGPEAVKKLRLAHLESRTALLAIAATSRRTGLGGTDRVVSSDGAWRKDILS